MQYLKIQNRGVLPRDLFFLMGASTKSDDETKIGQFGTGLKYAIAYCMRTKTPLKVFLGTRELKFTTKIRKIRGKDFECIYINDKNTNLTTKFGESWETWMAIREIWCNAIDEKNTAMEEIPEDHKDVRQGKAGHTTFLIGIDERVKEVIERWDEHFLTRDDAIYEDEKIVIYPSLGKSLKIYKRGILIDSRDTSCLFHYDIKNAELNELREFKGSLEYSIWKPLLIGSPDIVEKLRGEMNKAYRADERELPREFRMDYYLWDSSEEFKKKVKDMWQGRLYISKNSSKDSKHGIMVSDPLLSLLDACGLKTRTVYYSSGYGGSGFHSADWEEVPHPSLESRIERISKKLGISVTPYTMVPVNGSDNDFVYKKHNIYFNTMLEFKDDRELEAIILSAYIMDQDKKYTTMKRLIKSMLGNKSRLKKILQI